jgi:hypothetical protein
VEERVAEVRPTTGLPGKEQEALPLLLLRERRDDGLDVR